MRILTDTRTQHPHPPASSSSARHVQAYPRHRRARTTASPTPEGPSDDTDDADDGASDADDLIASRGTSPESASDGDATPPSSPGVGHSPPRAPPCAVPLTSPPPPLRSLGPAPTRRLRACLAFTPVSTHHPRTPPQPPLFAEAGSLAFASILWVIPRSQSARQT